MTVKQLRMTLETLDDNMEVVLQPQNSKYAETVELVRLNKGVCAFWGKGYKAIVLRGEQVGSVCDADEIAE